MNTLLDISHTFAYRAYFVYFGIFKNLQLKSYETKIFNTLNISI